MHVIPYFAYGSCMSPEDLRFTVDSEYIGVGQLLNHKVAFTRYAKFRRSGVADVVKSKNSLVEGVLLRVPNYLKLDEREGHPYVYRREMVRVFDTVSKKFIHAYTYKVVNKLTVEVPPSDEYSSLMLSSASKFLSKTYYQNLSTQIEVLQKKPFSLQDRFSFSSEDFLL